MASTFCKPTTVDSEKPGAVSLANYTSVRIEFIPYDHDTVGVLLKKAYKDFGRDKSRWCFRSPDIGQQDKNAWVLDFYFRDPKDALLFGLKYQNNYG